MKRDFKKIEDELNSIFQILNVQNSDEAIELIANLFDEVDSLKKKNESLKQKLQTNNNPNVSGTSDQYFVSEISQSENINSPLIQQKLNNADNNSASKIDDQIDNSNDQANKSNTFDVNNTNSNFLFNENYRIL